MGPNDWEHVHFGIEGAMSKCSTRANELHSYARQNNLINTCNQDLGQKKRPLNMILVKIVGFQL